MTAFNLDPRLAADTFPVADFALCAVRLMNDRRYPWLVLVPQRSGACEIVDLERDDRIRLIDEISTASSALQRIAAPHKINVAALGNRVRQLHVHVVARFDGDAAWPLPVWDKGPAEPYPQVAARAIIGKLADLFSSAS